MSVLFDELRSRLHGARTRAGFEEVCQCLDAWSLDDPELIELALPYADDALAAWPDTSRDAPAWGLERVATGDAPIWLELAACASYTNKLPSVVAVLDAHRGGALRRLHLGNVGIWSGVAAGVFGHPIMRKLTHLNLSGASFPLRVLTEHDTLEGLTSLDLSGFGGNLDGFYEAVEWYGLLGNLRALRLPRLWPGMTPLTHLTGAAFWPQLEVLDAPLCSRLSRRPREEVSAALGTLSGRLREVDLTLGSGSARALEALEARCPELETLRLSLASARLEGPLPEAPLAALRALGLSLCRLDADAVASLARAPALESLTLNASNEKLLVRLTSGLPALRELCVLPHFQQPTLGEHLGVFGRSPAAQGLERLVLILDEVGDEVLPGMSAWRKPALRELVLHQFGFEYSNVIAELLESGALPGLEAITLIVGPWHLIARDDTQRELERERWYVMPSSSPAPPELPRGDPAFQRVARAASARGVVIHRESTGWR